MENSSPLRLIFIGAEFILRDRHRIVRPAILVDAVAVRVANLFVGRSIAFDGALAAVWIFACAGAGYRHGGLLNGRVTRLL